MSDKITVLATEAIPAGAPLRITGSLGQGLWQVAIANTATESVDGWAPAAIANGKRGWMWSEGEGRINVGATVVALNDPVTDGGDGYFGNAGSIVFGRYLGAKNASNLALAIMDDLGSIGQDSAGGSGLPTDVFMDEYGNIIMGAANIAAFALVDNSAGKIEGCYVGPNATVTWPTNLALVTGIRDMRVYGGTVDLDEFLAGSIRGLLVTGTSNLVRFQSTVSTIAVANCTFDGHDGLYFDARLGGNISLNNLTINASAEIDADTNGGNLTIADSLITDNTALTINTGAVENVVIRDGLFAGGDHTIDSTNGTVGLRGMETAYDCSADYEPGVGGSLGLDGVSIGPGVFCNFAPEAACAVDNSSFEGSNSFDISPTAALTVDRCRFAGGSNLTPGGTLSIADSVVESNASLDCGGVTGAAAQVQGLHLLAAASLSVQGDSVITNVVIAQQAIETAGHDMDDVTIYGDSGAPIVLTGANVNTYKGFGLNTLV